MDEMTEVDISDGEDQEMAPLDPGDPDNLVPVIQATPDGTEWLKKRASAVVRLVRSDVESKQDWMDMREDQIKLYAGLVKRMGHPAPGARAPHDPIICRTILQGWTRGREQLIPAKGEIIQAHPVGSEDEMVAKERGEHMNWQFRHQIPNYETGVGESFHQFFMSGSTFREHLYDPIAKTTRFDFLTADDVTVSYALKDVDPLMRRVPRVTRHLRFYRWELEERERAGEIPEGTVKKLYAKGQGTTATAEESNLEKQAQEIDGVKPPSVSISVGEDGDDSALRLIHRVHMWMKLPDDDVTHAVTFTVDDATGIPISLKIREEEDPFDKERFLQEQKVWELATQNTKAQYEAALAGWTAPGPMGEPPPQTMGMPQPPAPEMPEPPEPCRMIPKFDMIHYRLFPNPHGFYGLGVAYLLTNANELVNALEAEYLLAARFANLKTGLLPVNAVAKGGELRVEMGKFIQTQLEPGEMAGIKEFTFSGPSEGLHRFIEGMKADAYSLVADIDTLSGQAGPTNETKAAAEQRMSNATAMMTAVTSIWLTTFKHEPQMLAKDNGRYGDERQQYWVTEANKADPNAAPKRVNKSISREAYASEFDITFTADQRLQTQPERVQTATNTIGALNNSPYAKDPTMGPPLFYQAFLALFRALDLTEMEKAMGPPPPPPQPKVPPPPPAPMSQVQENQMFMNEQDHPVLPDDMDEEHLLVIDDFEQSPFFAEMSSTGKQILDRHKRAHQAALYAKTATQGDQNGNSQRMGERPARGAPGMDGGPGDPGGQGAPALPPGPGNAPPSLPM